MKNNLLLFLFLSIIIPSISVAAVVRTLEIDFAFTAPDDPTKQLLGYRLYKAGVQVCESSDPLATKITCEVLTEDGTFDFSLAAYYSNNTESPQSPPFSYTVGTTPTTPPATPQGNKTITYSWQQNVSTVGIAGFRMYMNDTLLCQVDDPAATLMSCTANLINAPMAFSVASFDVNGIESPRSNILLLDPADFPELFLNRQLSFNWQYQDSASNVGGFNIYHNGTLLCQSAESLTRQLTCEAELSAPSHTFTMTAVDAAGVETIISNALTYTPISGTDPTIPGSGVLKAVITPTPAIGQAPLNVSFAATNSTGNISSYNWDFGDGTTGITSVINHSYPTPGTYTATLQVADLSGATDLASASITVQPSTSTPVPPTAVLSSSAAVGNAPLTVNFDGSSSTTTNPPIQNYNWTFGNGAQGTGETTANTYTVAGTYYAELTIQDSQGLTDTVNTPVIITGTLTPNLKPVATMSAGPIQGNAPLLVSFNGSQSYDLDGSIAQYDWNFGDGTTGSGKAVQHTYTTTGIYTVSLQVTDDKGDTASTNQNIACNATLPENQFTFEVGEVSIDQEWVKVLFENPYIQPVVIAGPPTTVNENEPVLTRISNIDQTGFEIRLQEWDYQDGSHAGETISYIVVEKGIFTLASGARVEAGSFSGSTSFQQIPLQQAYTTRPVILTQVMSENEVDAVTGRIQNIDKKTFEFKLQEQETSPTAHIDESIGYIAWEPGKDEFSGLLFEIGITTKTVTDSQFNLSFQTQFPDMPLFIADMQTYVDGDSGAVRGQNMSQKTTQIRIEEEQSQDTEIAHNGEAVGYLIIGDATAQTGSPAYPKKQFIFSWEYKDITNVTGYRLYLNQSYLCESTNPNDRQITCNSALLDTNMEFTMTSLFQDGTESDPSNLLSITPSDYPALLGIRLVSFAWDFDAAQEVNINGFESFNNGISACTTSDASSRQMACKVQTNESNNIFTIKAIDLSGTTSNSSNNLGYSP